MTWVRLTFGTLVLAGIAYTGITLYHGANRRAIHTIDILEPVEAIQERAAAVGVILPTQAVTIVWSRDVIQSVMDGAKSIIPYYLDPLDPFTNTYPVTYRYLSVSSVWARCHIGDGTNLWTIRPAWTIPAHTQWVYTYTTWFPSNDAPRSLCYTAQEYRAVNYAASWTASNDYTWAVYSGAVAQIVAAQTNPPVYGNTLPDSGADGGSAPLIYTTTLFECYRALSMLSVTPATPFWTNSHHTLGNYTNVIAATNYTRTWPSDPTLPELIYGNDWACLLITDAVWDSWIERQMPGLYFDWSSSDVFGSVFTTPVGSGPQWSASWSASHAVTRSQEWRWGNKEFPPGYWYDYGDYVDSENTVTIERDEKIKSHIAADTVITNIPKTVKFYGWDYYYSGETNFALWATEGTATGRVVESAAYINPPAILSASTNIVVTNFTDEVVCDTVTWANINTATRGRSMVYAGYDGPYACDKRGEFAIVTWSFTNCAVVLP